LNAYFIDNSIDVFDSTDKGIFNVLRSFEDSKEVQNFYKQLENYVSK
jgi:hypothetical protein